MPQRSRLARLLVPRFGTAWLFVGMLLLISAAGWWKFHRDLYVEEVEVLQKLRADGLSVIVRREDSGWASTPEDEAAIPWSAALLGPLQSLSIQGKPTTKQRNLALSLPRLSSYGEGPTQEQYSQELRRMLQEPRPDPFDVGTFLGTELPQFEEYEIEEERLETPLPNGEPVSERETARIAETVFSAWRRSDAHPERYLERSESVDHDDQVVREIRFRSGERAFDHDIGTNRVDEEAIYVLEDGVEFLYLGRGGDWKRRRRKLNTNFADFAALHHYFPHDAFPYHGLNLLNAECVLQTFDAMPRYELERVEKVDDVRYRVDFAPFAVDRIEDPDRSPFAANPKVLSWQCVLRSDLDWAPEEVRYVQQFQFQKQTKVSTRERRMVQRFRREGDKVLLVERLVQDDSVRSEAELLAAKRLLGAEAALAFPPPRRSKMRYATNLEPAVRDRAFDPLSLDPEPWPARRELTWLRWYRVTFLFGCGLAVTLVGRRFMPKRSKSEAPDEPQGAERSLDTTT